MIKLPLFLLFGTLCFASDALVFLLFSKFEEDGYVVIEGFLNDKDVEALKKECSNLIDDMNPEEHHTIFSTTKKVIF